MKQLLLTLSFLAMTCCNVLAQQDSTTLWLSTTRGNIYTLDLKTCTEQFKCHCRKAFLDIAQTPNGKLYGCALDSLFEIYPDGTLRGIGMSPMARGMVGLNDSILLMDSIQYLLAVKTTDASRQLIGYTGFDINGDFTWMGRNLYFTGNKIVNTITYPFLGKIYFNETYNQIQQIDSIAINPDSFYRPLALTTVYLTNQSGYSLIALNAPLGSYRVDTSTAVFYPICETTNNIAADSAYGASSMIFPPAPSLTSINENNFPDKEVNITPILLLIYFT